ncbi:MAG: hypothetical protein E6R03_07470 [Hyphomicrobiaceae bacterium]|nr:MAG: hypothetical protein E6R03_07470 [Hyphomicrobiaceae bacterium]
MLLEPLLKAATERPLTAKELGDVADLYHTTRAERLAADKVAANLKTVESQAEDLLIVQMLKQGITAAGGKKLRVGLSAPEFAPTVKDWGAFYQYIKDTGAFELLERRPGKAACRERWEAGEQVPGVEKFPVYKVTRNEVK